MNIIVAHIVSLLLAALDVAARGRRYALLMRGAGGSLKVRSSQRQKGQLEIGALPSFQGANVAANHDEQT